jgi:hypothetical protein
LDPARRWQVASLATAAASLGIGGLLLGRPSVEPAAPIVIDVSPGALPSAGDLPMVGDGSTEPPELVGPTVVDPLPPASYTSQASIESPAAPASSPSPTATSTTTPVPAAPAAPAEDRPDSPDSIDSVDSIDS